MKYTTANQSIQTTTLDSYVGDNMERWGQECSTYDMQICGPSGNVAEN